MVSIAIMAILAIVGYFVLAGDGIARAKIAKEELSNLKEEITAFMPSNSETKRKVSRTTQQSEGLEL